MNIIFLTISNINSIKERGIYADLMRKFRDQGHHVHIVSPAERRTGIRTHVIDIDGVRILKVKTLNIQKTNVIEKGIGTLLVESQFKRAIKKHFKGVSFDLITYSTPPITFTNVVKYLKKRNPDAISYLQLKDIFPQNAVDIGMFSKGSLFYKFFRKKEIELYKSSDFIGCMSPANVKYVLDHNNYISSERVEVAPNSIELKDSGDVDHTERDAIRLKYNLPTDKIIFIYGGNLGKPQGIDYLIKCLDRNIHRTDCYFVIVGNGTEYNKLVTWMVGVKSRIKAGDSINVSLIQRLPKEDYDKLVRSCDVGLIFLDYRFTIPNYPSRLLSYLENRMPVLCATDSNTDIGRIAENNGYGYFCESKNVEDFTSTLNRMVSKPDMIRKMGDKGYEFLKNNYLVDHTYNSIIKHIQHV